MDTIFVYLVTLVLQAAVTAATTAAFMVGFVAITREGDASGITGKLKVAVVVTLSVGISAGVAGGVLHSVASFRGGDIVAGVLMAAVSVASPLVAYRMASKRIKRLPVQPASRLGLRRI